MLEMLEDMEGAGLGGTREQAHISIILKKKSHKLMKATNVSTGTLSQAVRQKSLKSTKQCSAGDKVLLKKLG